MIMVGQVESYRVDMDAPLLFFGSKYAGLQP
jgi:hypothetical protein